MLPNSYSLDSQSRSQDLAASILSSSSPPQIAAACTSIESFLHSHSPEQSRHFFSLSFPTLICKLFGFDDASPSPDPLNQSSGWIDTVLSSNDLDLASRVFSLLAPGGVLLSSIAAVDRHSLVKYAFPNERLPQWARFLLLDGKACGVLSDLCPLFKDRVKEDSLKASSYQIQLNVFEYYMFWFAYYPICRGNGENFECVSAKKSSKFKLELWASSIPRFAGVKRGFEHKIECNLYIRLLYSYLRAFVPVNDLNSRQPYRSSVLHYSSGYDGSVVLQAEFLVNTLIQFWLVENDFSPVPVNLSKSFGVAFPFRSALGETPPPPGLGEVVKLLVKYLNLSSLSVVDGIENVEYSGSPRWASGTYDGAKARDVVSLSPHIRSVGSWNSLVQRPLYRFILRTFLFCPVGSSMKNVSQLFSVWISYLEPWKISWNDFAELDNIVDGSTKNAREEGTQSGCRYSSSWQGYVLSNYLYYSSLVVHFIGFAHKFLHADAVTIVQMVSKVIDVLTSSTELVDLIKNVDLVFHSKQTGSGKPMLNSLYRFIPAIREQLEDWEDGLCESDADGSFLHENWNKDLRLFSEGEDGGQQLLQLFILRAEVELQTVSGDNLANNLQCVDLLKTQISCLFAGSTLKPVIVTAEPHQNQQCRDEIFTPRKVAIRSSVGKYKGEWMKRPISSDEVAWLANLLVQLSNWLNENLGLNQEENSQVSPRWSYVELPSETGNASISLSTMKVMLCAWFLMFGTGALRLMRKYNLRINLRILSSKKVVMVLFLYVVFSVLRKAYGMLWSM